MKLYLFLFFIVHIISSLLLPISGNRYPDFFSAVQNITSELEVVYNRRTDNRYSTDELLFEIFYLFSLIMRRIESTKTNNMPGFKASNVEISESTLHI